MKYLSMTLVKFRNFIRVFGCMGSFILMGSLVFLIHSYNQPKEMQYAVHEKHSCSVETGTSGTASMATSHELPLSFPQFPGNNINVSWLFAVKKIRAINPKKFRNDMIYKSQPADCLSNKKVPAMVLFVSSRPSSTDMRAAIRETWGLTAASCMVKVVFGFGRQKSSRTQQLIEVESSVYGDVLQSNKIRDGYRNQTALVLFFFQWAADHCKAPLVGKADDDTWLNFPLIMPFLKTLPYAQFTVGFHFQPGSAVIRDTRHAQFLTKNEYWPDLFPVYASGILYVFSAVTLPMLLRKAITLRQHWIDDVYISGDLVEEINKNCNTFGSHACIQRVNFWGLANWPSLRDYSGCHLINSTAMHKIDPLMKRLVFYLPCLEDIKLCE